MIHRDILRQHRENKKYYPHKYSGESLGLVRFPVDDPEWVDTAEGMLVKLVMVPLEESRWLELHRGAYVKDILSGRLMGDNRREQPQMSYSAYSYMYDEYCYDDRSFVEYIRFWGNLRSWREYHYPCVNMEDARADGLPGEAKMSTELEAKLSIPYLGVIVMGVTTWSGFSETAPFRYWQCTLGDLTVDGQRLVSILDRIYPDVKLHLLTFVNWR